MSKVPLTLTFVKGAGMVTGSNFLLSSPEEKILVDCGLVQGCHFCEDENFAPFPYDPKSIKTLLVTHAHMDHIGRIPLLVQRGFTGAIVSTPATRDIARELLYDNVGLLAREAARRGRSPLYGEKEVERALSLWKSIPYRHSAPLAGDLTYEFLDAGHILGSAMIKIAHNERSLIFTGDLGNDESVLLPPTESIAGATYLVIESVYGDRTHEEAPRRREKLARALRETLTKGGTVLIPAFAAERTQDILFELNDLVEKKEIPETPVYVDSPLAIRITEIYRSYTHLFADSVRERIARGDDIFSFPRLHYTNTKEESLRIEKHHGPKIILAGAGMSNGGRILRHEKKFLPEKSTTVLFVGYQAVGALGRIIEGGAKKVEIEGERIPVRARIETISGYSAHKDSPGLVRFVEKAAGTLESVFVVLGEPRASLFLVQRLREYLGVNANAPTEGERVEISL